MSLLVNQRQTHKIKTETRKKKKKDARKSSSMKAALVVLSCLWQAAAVADAAEFRHDGSTALFATLPEGTSLHGLVSVAYWIRLADPSRFLQYTVGLSAFDSATDTETPKALGFSTSPPWGGGGFMARDASSFFCGQCVVPELGKWVHVQHVWDQRTGTVRFLLDHQQVDEREIGGDFALPLAATRERQLVLVVGGGPFAFGNLFYRSTMLEGGLRGLNVSVQGEWSAYWELEDGPGAAAAFSSQGQLAGVELSTALPGVKQRLRFMDGSSQQPLPSAQLMLQAADVKDLPARQVVVTEGAQERVRLTTAAGKQLTLERVEGPAADPFWLCAWPEGKNTATYRAAVSSQQSCAALREGDAIPDGLVVVLSRVGFYSPTSEEPLGFFTVAPTGERVDVVVEHVNQPPSAVSATLEHVADTHQHKLSRVTLDASDQDETFSQGQLFYRVLEFPDWGNLWQDEQRTVPVNALPAATARQWAHRVLNASSQYSDCAACNGPGNVLCGPAQDAAACPWTGWMAVAILGEPDAFPRYGDLGQGWQTTAQDAPHEWIEVELAFPVVLQELKSYEIFNPGAIVHVLGAREWTGTETTKWATLWRGLPADDRPRGESWVFEPEGLCPSPWPVRALRLEMDHSLTPGWTNYDALELIGTLAEPTGSLASNVFYWEPWPGVVWADSHLQQQSSARLVVQASDCLASSEPSLVSLQAHFYQNSVWHWTNLTTRHLAGDLVEWSVSEADLRLGLGLEPPGAWEMASAWPDRVAVPTTAEEQEEGERVWTTTSVVRFNHTATGRTLLVRLGLAVPLRAAPQPYLSTQTASGLLAFFVFVAALVLVTCAALTACRHTRHVKARSFVFCLVMLAGMLVALAGAHQHLARLAPWTGEDSAREATCRTAPVLLHAGAALTMSAVLTRAYRITRIFFSHKLTVKAITNRVLLETTAAVWAVVTAPHVAQAVLADHEFDASTGECTSKGTQVASVLGMVLQITLLASAVAVVWKTRNVPIDDLSDAKPIMLATYNAGFSVAVFGLLLSGALSLSAKDKTVILCAASGSVVCTTCALLFGPVLMQLARRAVRVGVLGGGSSSMLSSADTSPQQKRGTRLGSYSNTDAKGQSTSLPEAIARAADKQRASFDAFSRATKRLQTAFDDLVAKYDAVQQDQLVLRHAYEAAASTAHVGEMAKLGDTSFVPAMAIKKPVFLERLHTLLAELNVSQSDVGSRAERVPVSPKGSSGRRPTTTPSSRRPQMKLAKLEQKAAAPDAIPEQA